jgi:hypothetical protein
MIVGPNFEFAAAGDLFSLLRRYLGSSFLLDRYDETNQLYALVSEDSTDRLILIINRADSAASILLFGSKEGRKIKESTALPPPPIQPQIVIQGCEFRRCLSEILVPPRSVSGLRVAR